MADISIYANTSAGTEGQVPVVNANGLLEYTNQSNLSAGNVSSTINNKNISDIFENDGITAKKSTKVSSNLLFGSKTYDGSTERTITISDLMPLETLNGDFTFVVGDEGFLSFFDSSVGYFYMSATSCALATTPSGSFSEFRIQSGKLQIKVDSIWITATTEMEFNIRWINKAPRS